ncbi:tRNA-guanine transglycosylase [uncultured Pleomorphomonas sp.]|uniref:Queuine tRNA-ribosyltransferase n=2 Tax=uncultured Pleomorphomonas sp. TaxID=442121 RepID=A0A212L914_9HYPH|nr:tRNA-guanine transglycosylase [uncultured Pleomorphomonas sp.]
MGTKRCPLPLVGESWREGWETRRIRKRRPESKAQPMTQPFSFRLLATDGRARRGEILTPHGVVRTPAFMPVGTLGTVKAMFMDDVKATGADVILGNTYHLMLRPGAERVAALGGLHKFSTWDKTILTDSGGFQVMSLAKLRRMDEQGVTFQSHIDGSRHELTPERSIEIQGLLGSDIQMQLDECVRLPAEPKEVERGMRLSLRWAERSRRQFEAMGGPQKGQGLYGIVQGGDVSSLREISARELSAMPFEGYSVGGLAVGEPQAVMLEMIDVVDPILPQGKPRYLMGVGTPDDIIESVARGIDQFDCVMPTRAGRHGLAYTRFGKLNFKNARHMDDPRPIDPTSDCPAARDYSRAYIHHLVRTGESLGAMLLTWVNVAYYQSLMAGIRDSIEAGRFEAFKAETKAAWARGENG